MRFAGAGQDQILGRGDPFATRAGVDLRRVDAIGGRQITRVERFTSGKRASLGWWRRRVKGHARRVERVLRPELVPAPSDTAVLFAPQRLHVGGRRGSM
jgi:hypothetical protein